MSVVWRSRCHGCRKLFTFSSSSPEPLDQFQQLGDRDRFGNVYFVTTEAVRKNKFRFGLQLYNSSLNIDPEVVT